MLWILLIAILLMGQETMFILIVSDIIGQPVVNYNDPATIYHKYCGHGTVLAYANEFLPDGVTTTTSFLDLYS